MANEINRLIEMLYEKVEDARPVTLQPGMCKLDRDEILDLLDELKAQIPGEIKRAQELLSAREKFIDDAKREAERIVRDAEADAKKRVAESVINRAAREESGKLLAQAEDNSMRLYRMASEYAEDVLARAEEAMQTALDTVKDNRNRFRAVSAAKLQDQRDRLAAQNAAEQRTPPPAEEPQEEEA